MYKSTMYTVIYKYTYIGKLHVKGYCLLWTPIDKNNAQPIYRDKLTPGRGAVRLLKHINTCTSRSSILEAINSQW